MFKFGLRCSSPFRVYIKTWCKMYIFAESSLSVCLKWHTPSENMGSQNPNNLRPNKKKLLCCPFGDKILRLGRSVENLFKKKKTCIHVPRVKVRAPKQNMHSKWWQRDCQSTFLAVKPKTEEFNTILTTKLNDPVLKLASFVTNLQ